jgi:hypothetical protein
MEVRTDVLNIEESMSSSLRLSRATLPSRAMIHARQATAVLSAIKPSFQDSLAVFRICLSGARTFSSRRQIEDRLCLCQHARGGAEDFAAVVSRYLPAFDPIFRLRTGVMGEELRRPDGKCPVRAAPGSGGTCRGIPLARWLRDDRVVIPTYNSHLRDSGASRRVGSAPSANSSSR